MGYPRDLAEVLVRDCTVKYKTSFNGFGKHRPLAVRNTKSQEKKVGEKVALYMDFSGCGLKVRHLRTLMRAFASDASCGLRAHPLPATIASLRREEIGDQLRCSDDFIMQMLN